MFSTAASNYTSFTPIDPFSTINTGTTVAGLNNSDLIVGSFTDSNKAVHGYIFDANADTYSDASTIRRQPAA